MTVSDFIADVLPGQLVDSHVHLDVIHTHFPRRISWLKKHCIVPISWSFDPDIHTCTQLNRYLANQAAFIRELNSEGFECYFLTGIHPRNIPPELNPDDVRQMLLPYLENPLCLGLGEIGLETGSEAEADILTAQLNLAEFIRSRNKKIGIHTPRKNKPAVTRKLLGMLDDYQGIESMTVIDHCTNDTIGWVLERGFWTGITLSPEKTSVAELKKIIATRPHAHDRIMCNTDSGVTFSEDFYQFSKNLTVSEGIRQALTSANARTFFNL